MLRIKRGDFCDMVSVVLGINKSSVSVSHSCCCCLRESRGSSGKLISVCGNLDLMVFLSLSLGVTAHLAVKL